MVDRRQLLAGAAVLTVFVGYLLVSPRDAVAAVDATVTSPWFPAILVGLYLVRPLLAWPITLLSALVGYRYGVVVGVPIALVGAVATSLIPYAVGRSVRTDTGWVGRLAAGGDTYFRTVGDLRGVIAARLAPTPAEAISAGAGIARVPVPAFIVGTIVGEMPWTIAAVAVGATLNQATSLEAVIVDPRLVVAGVIAAVLILAGPVYRHLRTRT